MPSKTKIKKSSKEILSLDIKKGLISKKNNLTQRSNLTKDKSKISRTKLKSQLSFQKITPSLVSGKSEIPAVDDNLAVQYSSPCLLQHKRSQLTVPAASQIYKKNRKEKAGSTDYDYDEFQSQKQKSRSKWIKQNYRGSLVYDQIFNQYGYSNLSNFKLNGQKSMSNLSKKNKKLSQKQQIQRLLAKYSKHLEVPQKEGAQDSKSKNFRTLSTDDKSEKKIQFSKKPKLRRKIVQNNKCLNNLITENQKLISANNNKRTKSVKKKKSSKTILPDYFGCLSINKVQSKIQMMKQKQLKNSAKNTRQINETQKNNHRKKEQQKLVLTKVKQQKQVTRQNKELSNKQTKKTNFGRHLVSQRSTVSPFKLKSQDKIKVKDPKRSRKTSRKQLKQN